MHSLAEIFKKVTEHEEDDGEFNGLRAAKDDIDLFASLWTTRLSPAMADLDFECQPYSV